MTAYHASACAMCSTASGRCPRFSRCIAARSGSRRSGSRWIGPPDRAIVLSLGVLGGAEVTLGREDASDARSVLYGLQSRGRLIAATLDDLPALA